MSDPCPPTDPRKVAANRDGNWSGFFLGLAVLALIRASEATAADQAPKPAVMPPGIDSRGPPAAPLAARRSLSTAWLPAPREYALPPLAEAHAWEDARAEADTQALDDHSTGEFRPRGRSMFDADPVIADGNDHLMIDKTVWQRLQEYRSHDRIRVLTLWESGASAISLQADRKGDPSLQWTSRWMNRGGATRGLLDRWMPVSMFRSFPHFGRASSGKPSAPPPAAHPEMAATP